jgi:AraC-like DNA-binding protein/ligand-binding sensor protein
MESSKHEALSNYMKFVTTTYGIQLCFNDFTGFIAIDKDLDRVLRPFMAHTNPYCMYIKSDRTLFNKCLSLKKKIAEKSINLQKTFYGYCHAGVGEYIIPITSQGVLIGVINAGVFQIDSKIKDYLIQKICKKTQLQKEVASQLYYQSTTKDHPDQKIIMTILELVADYLGNSYLNLLSTHQGLNLGVKRYNSSEDSILAHVLEYINQNYFEPLTVLQIANFCHCSESYINHLFKKRVGINIKLYINKIRVEHARSELIDSDAKIANIALKVGFNDPNYFSRIFAEITGIPPVEYRRRFS